MHNTPWIRSRHGGAVSAWGVPRTLLRASQHMIQQRAPAVAALGPPQLEGHPPLPSPQPMRTSLLLAIGNQNHKPTPRFIPGNLLFLAGPVFLPFGGFRNLGMKILIESRRVDFDPDPAFFRSSFTNNQVRRGFQNRGFYI